MWVDRSEDWDGEEEDVVSFRDREPVYQRGIVYYLRGDKVLLSFSLAFAAFTLKSIHYIYTTMSTPQLFWSLAFSSKCSLLVFNELFMTMP